MASPEPEPKKKRRQNVACDSCKLRRIKCDLFNLLVPADTPSSSNPPPLHALVQANPGVSCTNCRKKDLRCTTNSIINPSKPNKGGRRISQARKLFGGDESEEDDDWPGESSGETPFGTKNTEFPGGSTSSVARDDPRLIARLVAAPPGQTLPDTETEAQNIWIRMTENHNWEPSGDPSLIPKALVDQSIGGDDVLDLHAIGDERAGLDARRDLQTLPIVSNTFQAHVTGLRSQLDGYSSKGTVNFPNKTWAEYRPTPMKEEVVNIKRKRQDSPVEPMLPLIVSHPQDPYRLWAEEKRVVLWGRTEEVQERLADRALGLELSRHLIKTFFHSVYLGYPAINAEGFYLEWLRAGQCSDNMSPSLEVLCAVLEAWGARFSDNPVVLGLTGWRAAHSPKVLRPDGTLVPGTAARVHWGRSRLAACNALSDRARRLIDYNGLLRRPTVTGVQALLMYNLLVHMTDQRNRAADQYMQTQLTHAAVIEQMTLLQLMWDSHGQIPIDHQELPLTTAQLRMKQRRIFWAVMVTDAVWAAGSAQEPRVRDEDIEASAKWLLMVNQRLPPSTFKSLAYFLKCYLRITFVSRDIARRLSVPCKRPGTVDVPSFCAIVREVWMTLKTYSKNLVNQTAKMLSQCDHVLIGFSPVNVFCELVAKERGITSRAELLIIRHQLDFRKDLKAAYIVEEVLGRPQNPEEKNIAMLENLHMQSVDILLQNARGNMGMFKALLPTGLIQTASVFLRVLIATGQFLSEVPTNEQGYPANTVNLNGEINVCKLILSQLGGLGWTWEEKKKQVGVCVEALHQVVSYPFHLVQLALTTPQGWAWGDINEVLDSITVSMEQMEPTVETIEKYKRTRPPTNQRIAAAVEIDERDAARAVDEIMDFWPPESVPSMIERAMEGVDVTNASPTELAVRIMSRDAGTRSIRHRRPRQSSEPPIRSSNPNLTPSLGETSQPTSGRSTVAPETTETLEEEVEQIWPTGSGDDPISQQESEDQELLHPFAIHGNDFHISALSRQAFGSDLEQSQRRTSAGMSDHNVQARFFDTNVPGHRFRNAQTSGTDHRDPPDWSVSGIRTSAMRSDRSSSERSIMATQPSVPFQGRTESYQSASTSGSSVEPMVQMPSFDPNQDVSIDPSAQMLNQTMGDEYFGVFQDMASKAGQSALVRMEFGAPGTAPPWAAELNLMSRPGFRPEDIPDEPIGINIPRPVPRAPKSHQTPPSAWNMSNSQPNSPQAGPSQQYPGMPPDKYRRTAINNASNRSNHVSPPPINPDTSPFAQSTRFFPYGTANVYGTGTQDATFGTERYLKITPEPSGDVTDPMLSNPTEVLFQEGQSSQDQTISRGNTPSLWGWDFALDSGILGARGQAQGQAHAQDQSQQPSLPQPSQMPTMDVPSQMPSVASSQPMVLTGSGGVCSAMESGRNSENPSRSGNASDVEIDPIMITSGGGSTLLPEAGIPASQGGYGLHSRLSTQVPLQGVDMTGLNGDTFEEWEKFLNNLGEPSGDPTQ